MKIKEIGRLENQESFEIALDKEAGLNDITDQLVRDYKEFYDRGAFCPRESRLAENLTERETTMQVVPGGLFSDGPENFVRILVSAEFENGFPFFRVARETSDVYHFMEFYSDLMNKYMG